MSNDNDVVAMAFEKTKDEVVGGLYVHTRGGKAYKVVVGVGLDLVPMPDERRDDDS